MMHANITDTSVLGCLGGLEFGALVNDQERQLDHGVINMARVCWKCVSKVQLGSIFTLSYRMLSKGRGESAPNQNV